MINRDVELSKLIDNLVSARASAVNLKEITLARSLDKAIVDARRVSKPVISGRNEPLLPYLERGKEAKFSGKYSEYLNSEGDRGLPRTVATSGGFKSITKMDPELRDRLARILIVAAISACLTVFLFVIAGHGVTAP